MRTDAVRTDVSVGRPSGPTPRGPVSHRALLGLLAVAASYACLLVVGHASALGYVTFCPDGTVAQGVNCPIHAGAGPTLRGSFTSTAATTTTSSCPVGWVVVSIVRYRDPFNTYTGGVYPNCRALPSSAQNGTVVPPGTTTAGPLIGRASSVSAETVCPPDRILNGFAGRSGDVIDGFNARCRLGISQDVVNGAYVGGSGGTARGPFECPYNMYARGLTGTAANYGSGYNVYELRPNCADAWAVRNGSLGSAATGSTRAYRASGSQGPVKFSMLISKALDKPSSWYYGIQRIAVATSCAQSTRVPGAIVVSDRRRASQHPRFSSRLGRFRVKGSVSGSLAKPKVRATVKVLKGACRGEAVSFTAANSRLHR